ncbi:MAG TPA: amidohydrolase family protein [Roseiflexaceae bacterium]|nr:amidohydrolase family protein [Roseiflexaceae bacterium]
MPDFPIVDAHVHLWDPQHFPLLWLAGSPVLNQPYGLDEYRAHTAGVDVAAFVYVQVDVEAPFGLLEAQWAVDCAAEDPRLQGIVAYAPVEYGEQSRSYLQALVAHGPLIKGVRRLLQGEPDASFCLRPGFVSGVQLLAEFGLSFDICIRHHQLAAAIELVRRCPDVSFILDHIGKPDIKNKQLEPWRAQITELATLPNVMCKVSGVVTEADRQSWTPDDIAPYVAHVLDAFGQDRVAFGSDWPVVLEASAYRRWVETLDTLTAHFSPKARQQLWAGNARRFYRLSA